MLLKPDRFYAGLNKSVSYFMGLVSYSMKLISDSIRECVAGGYKTLVWRSQTRARSARVWSQANMAFCTVGMQLSRDYVISFYLISF